MIQSRRFHPITLRSTSRPLTRPAVLLLAALIGPGLLAARGEDQEPRRPNFVFVYSDDQRWDTLGVVQREQGDKGRFPWLRDKTPNFDRLANEGVRFRNAFVVNSLCAPSRASFLTGRYGHFNGVVNNHTPFPVDSVTYASLLRKAGYRTGYIGKWHMGRQSGQRPGFDYSASFVGQGRYVDCPFEVNGEETPTKGWVDDVSTDYALDFLRENRDRPFSLAVGFKSAHGPFDPPDRLDDALEGEQARPVPNLDDPPPYIQRDTPAAAKKKAAAAEGRTNLGYFRCILAADQNLGRILGALDELGLAENTMVIYTSDNGYYLGEHRLGDKRSAYDESLRIPLLVRYPRLGSKLKGRTIDRMALNIDVAPTLLDYAGVEVPEEMQGRSWRPLFEGKDGDWRKAFFYCYFFETRYRVPTVTAVRTESAKLVKYPGHDDWTQMFDLAADPYETKNLYSDPAHAALRRSLEAEYTRQKEAVKFRIPDFADDPEQDRPKPALNDRVLDYRFGNDEGDRVVDASKYANHGNAQNAPLVDGRDGHKARRFDGRGVIEVPKSSSLDPAVQGWTVAATIKPDKEKPTGIILASGGASNGYALSLDAGKPAFTVNTQNTATRIDGSKPVTSDWIQLSARITADQKLELLVDGTPVARGTLRAPLRTPNEPTQIGADLGSQVLDGRDDEAPRFVGLIESVRIDSGTAP